jgi:hypothetical protein
MSDPEMLPDLPQRFERVVGNLSLLSVRLGEEDARLVEEAMSLLAGVQAVVCVEVDVPPSTLGAEAIATQLNAFRSIGPRTPSAARLLANAAGFLRLSCAAEVEARELRVAEGEPCHGSVTINAHGPVTVNVQPEANPRTIVVGPVRAEP